LLFFFSSRRRHTRCYRDWSSDVCSSDLLSATTMRNTGLFFAPIRFIRILTAINQNAQFGRRQMTLSALRRVGRWFQKRGEPIQGVWAWQAPFLVFWPGRACLGEVVDHRRFAVAAERDLLHVARDERRL